eukprot:7832712-Ditylum_brightwellii.AAC.2
MSVVDSSEINGFDAMEHIDFEFGCKDKHAVPTKVKVIKVDEDTRKALLEYVHGGLEWVEQNILQEALLTITNGKIEVEVLWDNGKTSWESLAVLSKDDLVTLSGYAKERRLLEQHGWKWAKSIAKDEKKFVRMLKLMKASKKYQKKSYGKKTYKFGVQVPRTGDVRDAMKLDPENGSSPGFDAQKKEASTLRDMDAFELIPENFDLTGYQYVPLIFVWDIKFDGRRRVCLVANRKVTIGPPEEDV